MILWDPQNKRPPHHFDPELERIALPEEDHRYLRNERLDWLIVLFMLAMLLLVVGIFCYMNGWRQL